MICPSFIGILPSLHGSATTFLFPLFFSSRAQTWHGSWFMISPPPQIHTFSPRPPNRRLQNENVNDPPGQNQEVSKYESDPLGLVIYVSIDEIIHPAYRCRLCPSQYHSLCRSGIVVETHVSLSLEVEARFTDSHP